MTVLVKTAIDIDAPPERVWAVLGDLGAYPAWNPLIRSAEGRLAAGERLQVEISVDGEGRRRFRPTVLAAEPGRELRWLGRMVAPGVFDGEHRFAIAPTPTGSRLVHEERFRGLLVPFFARTLRRDLPAAFDRANRALKARAEAA